MSGSEVASLAISAAALLAVIASNLVFAKQAREMRAQSERLARDLALSAGGSVNQWFVEISRTFIEYPRLRLVFYPDEARRPLRQLSEEEELRAATLCEHFLDAFQDAADFEKDALVPWSSDYHAYFSDLFRGSDFLYRFLQQRASWYPPELHAAAKHARASAPAEER